MPVLVLVLVRVLVLVSSEHLVADLNNSRGSRLVPPNREAVVSHPIFIRTLAPFRTNEKG